MPDRNREPLVLVVDDYEDSRDMYAASLSLSGFRVVKAADGAEALDLAVRTGPDLILMDLSLPGIDGFEVTRRLKEDDRTRHIPIVALTAYSLDFQPGELTQQGFEGLLLKPCPLDALAAEVMRQIEVARSLAREGVPLAVSGRGSA